jgi:hypothetical protein
LLKVQKNESEIYQKKAEIKEFPQAKEIDFKQERLDVVIEKIQNRQNLARVEHDKHLSELRERGIDIREIHWEKIEHKNYAEVGKIVDIDNERQMMINLANSALTPDKNMPDLDVKITLDSENKETPYLKDKDVKIIEAPKVEPTITATEPMVEPKETPDTKPNIFVSNKTVQSPKVPETESDEQKNLFGEIESKKQTGKTNKNSTVSSTNISKERRFVQLNLFDSVKKSEDISQRKQETDNPATVKTVEKTPVSMVSDVSKTWKEIKDARFSKVEGFGDKADMRKRIYIITEHDGTISANIPDGKGGKYSIANSEDIPIEKMKLLIEQQFDSLMEGKPLEYEKKQENIKAQKKEDYDGPDL